MEFFGFGTSLFTRAVYYAAKTFADQQKAGQGFDVLKKTVGILILGCTLFSGDQGCTPCIPAETPSENAGRMKWQDGRQESEASRKSRMS